MKNINTLTDRLDECMGWEYGTSHVNEGSKTYGIAFRLCIINENTGAHMNHPFGDFLGMTKTEAYGALAHIVKTARACKQAHAYFGGQTLDEFVQRNRTSP